MPRMNQLPIFVKISGRELFSQALSAGSELVTYAPPDNGMHPTADTLPLKYLQGDEAVGEIL
jgi:hypothetical protein